MAARSASATRLRTGNPEGGNMQFGGGSPSGRQGGPTSKGGMGDRAVSLPSLFPQRGGAGGAGGAPGYPGGSDKPGMKRAPSELLLERQQFGAAHAGQKPKITAFLDLAQYSNYTNPVVPVDQPLFSVTPPVITFSDFEGLQTYEATVTLRNQDNVARRVKVYPPDSHFFELASGGRARGKAKASSGSGSSGGDKVAPGMEVTYTIRFRPDARIDYSHDLVVITEREKFTVPVRASGGSALLEFPDHVDFGADCVVGHQSERTVLVRNVGDRPAKFLLRTNPPFSVHTPVDHLAEGAHCQVQIHFTPERAGVHQCDLHLKYGGLEAVSTLRGAAQNADVSLSHSLLVIGDTYVGLESQGVVTIRNDSDVPVDFSWRLFPSVVQEQLYRSELQSRLKLEERDETLYMQQAQNSEDSSDDSCSDEERLRARREAKVNSGLSRKYGNISKAVAEDPMLFRDVTFAVAPLSGTIWAHSQLTCACTFCPRDALVYSCTAYLSCVGQEERAPLVLRGLGIGPKASFSYNDLFVGNVFVKSEHRYEVQLLNQGDIEVDFRLNPPKESKPDWNFQPSSGTIEVGGQCEIVVDFKPGDLGPFHEIFEWTLKGSAQPVSLTFRGKSVEPTFQFDEDKINFGTVSFGFLNSRMLTLTNTAEVPIIYNLRVPGDGMFPDNEFTLIPSKGTLLPNCAQRVQIDFVSLTEKTYDVRLAVDLEDVGKELHAVPIRAQCAVPQVSFEPHGTLSYGDIFIRYPFHQSLYLHNTSTLPAKFEVMQQDDKCRAEFEPDQWVGTVPPCASHVITVTVTAHQRGAIRIPMYVKIHGRAVPFPLVLVANSIGPLVQVDPPMVDWGNQVKCLTPVVRHVRLTNNSRIDASVRAFMNERKSLWSVHPKTIHLSPQETLQLALTLKIDECCTANDTLNLVVNEGNDLTVSVKGKGIGTPIRCDTDVESIDFGMLFTTHTEPKDIVIRNYGQYGRRITWVREKEPKVKGKKEDEPPAKKGKKVEDEEPQPPVFRVEPENAYIEPRSAYRFTLLAMSPTPGSFTDSLICNETPDKGSSGAKPVFTSNFSAQFIAPLLALSRRKMDFKFHWERDKPIERMTERLMLSNTGDLEVGFTISVKKDKSPFSADTDEGSIPPHSEMEILVDFDPAFTGDRTSKTFFDKLIIQYDDHPMQNVVDLEGEVVWPNIQLDKDKLDFGYVLNDTTKKLELKMHNPTDLTVAYTWYFGLKEKDEALGRSAMQSPAATGNSFGRAPASTASLLPPTGPLTAGASSLNWAPSSVKSLTGDEPGDRLGVGGAITALGASAASGFTGAASTVGPASTRNEFNQSNRDIDLNQIFDILPIFGKIEKGETQITTFTYCALKDRSFKAVAYCSVDGGPEYHVHLKGAAASCRFTLDKPELDFGEIPFTEVGELDIILQNPSKVPASFNFNLSGLSRPFVVDITPSHGTLKPEDKVKCMVKFRAGIPNFVTETVLVEVAHFEPTKLVVKGTGTFPGVVLDLKRKNEEEHMEHLEAAAQRRGRPSSAAGRSEAGGIAAGGSALLRQSTGAFASRQSTVAIQPEASAVDPISPRPRSAATDALTVGGGVAPQWDRCANLDLPLEFEVDRHYLCEMLLKGVGVPEKTTDMNSTMRTTGRKETTLSPARTTGMKKKEPPPVTAASYLCDFGYIALGQSKTNSFTMHNCGTEAVYISIDKKLLKEKGFIVEPEVIKKLEPNKSVNMSVTATRDREVGEGVSELNWNLPVKGGPNYVVSLHASFVLPEITLSTEAVDFGRVLVGQKKSFTLMMRNEKDVPVEWKFMQALDRYGKKPPPQEVIFDLSPPAGTLMPGEKRLIVVSFSPPAHKMAMTHSSSLQLRLADNPDKKKITVIGRSDVLRMEVKPGTTYELGPILPNGEGDAKEFFVHNPTDYPIEVYSADFDSRFSQERKMVTNYFEKHMEGLAGARFGSVAGAGTKYMNLIAAPGLKAGQVLRLNPGGTNEEDCVIARFARSGEGLPDLVVTAEPLRYKHALGDKVEPVGDMPTRLPGDPVWRPVHAVCYDLQEKARAEELSRKVTEDGGKISRQVSKLPDQEAPAVVDEADAKEPEVAIEELGAEDEPEDESVAPNPMYYPLRVPDKERHSAVIFGPPKSGQTTIANRLAQEDQRMVLQVDDAISWALKRPKVLLPDRYAKKIIDKITAGTKPEVEEVSHLLTKRMELPDCNAGVIIDGLVSEYFGFGQAASAIFAALKGEQMSFMRVELPSEAEPASAGGSPADGAPPVEGEVVYQPTPEGAKFQSHLEVLKDNLDSYIADLNASLPELETAFAAAEEALQAANEAAVVSDDAAREAAAAAAVTAAARAAAAQARLDASAKAIAAGTPPGTSAQGKAKAKAQPKEAPRPGSGVGKTKADAEADENENAAEEKYVEVIPEDNCLAAFEVIDAAKLELYKTRTALEACKAEIERCEAAKEWNPPKVPPPEDQPATPPPDPKAKKGGPTEEELKAKASQKAARDFDAIAITYAEMSAEADGAVEEFIQQCRGDEEDKQRELEKRRRSIAAKKRDAKARARPGLAKAKAEPKLSISESVEYITAMEKFEEQLPLLATTFELRLPPAPKKPEAEEEVAEPPSPTGSPKAGAASPAAASEPPVLEPPSVLEILRERFPLPSIPAETPSAPPTKVQVLYLPQERPELQRPTRFKIWTPKPPKSRSPSKEAADTAAVEAAIAAGEEPPVPEPPKEEYDADRHRWIIEPHEELRLLVHFNSDEVQDYSEALTFELVDDVTRTATTINVSGVANLPGISKDPRLIFIGRRKKKRPGPGTFCSKSFVMSIGVYDFGPLLAGREPTSRIPPPTQSLEDADPDADPDAVATPAGVDGAASGTDDEATGEVPLETPSSPTVIGKEIMRHSETIRITNDSLFPATVRLGLESNPPPEDGAEYDPEEAAKAALESQGPFIIEPPTLQLDIGESQDVKVWCFPPESVVEEAGDKGTKGLIKDKLIARIQHNPEPVVFGLTALGALPWAEVTQKVLDEESAGNVGPIHVQKPLDDGLDFGKMLSTAEEPREKVLVLKNPTLMPVRWQFQCLEASIVDHSGEKVEISPSSYYKLPPKKKKEVDPETGEPVADTEEAQELPPMVPQEFDLQAYEGILMAGASQEVKIGFKAAQPAKYSMALGLQVRDTEGFRSLQQACKFDVKSETFSVEVVVEGGDLKDNALDFGQVLVNTPNPQSKTFEIVNQGRFAVKYKFAVRRGILSGLLQFQNDCQEGELEANERKTITIMCTPKKIVTLDTSKDSADGIELKIYDRDNQDDPNIPSPPVNHAIPPIRVAVTAVYNAFMVTPPRGVNFGPVEKGQSLQRTFSIRNNGIFPFDWRLFDQGNPPTMGDDDKPPSPEATIKVGPFTVTPTSGNIAPEGDMEVTVTFDADDDSDHDSKLAIWVDGVQNDGPDATVSSARGPGGSGGFGQGSPNVTATVSAIPGTSTYLISGNSCVPGINTTDLQSIFEEQFYARNLEDAVAIAGRPDVRVFCEADQIFSFGPVLSDSSTNAVSTPASPAGGAAPGADKGIVERFRLSNPKAIACKVDLVVRSKGSSSEPLAFSVEPESIVIPPHDSEQILVYFKPEAIQNNYSGILEATVQGGTDPLTNFLSFELRGDGAVPSMSLQGPPLFGDDGGELQLGKLTVGRSHEVRMALRNNGQLPATARVDWKSTPHFTVTCPASVALKRGESRPFQVRFHPRSPGRVTAELAIRTIGNPFEDVKIQLSGEGYADDIAWDLTSIRRPGGRAGGRVDEGPSESSVCAAPDELLLGEVAFGRQVHSTFHLTNNTGKPLRFEFPETMPAPFGEQLKIEPLSGFVDPNSRHSIDMTFVPTGKVKADLVPFPCKMVQVEFEEPEDVPAQDPSPTESGDLDKPKERPFKEVDGTTRDVPLKVSVTADEQLLECDIVEYCDRDQNPMSAEQALTAEDWMQKGDINFHPTIMFCTKVHRFTMKNPTTISAPFDFRVLGKTASVFSVTPASGAVPPEGEKEIEVRFSPQEVDDFTCTLSCLMTGSPGTMFHSKTERQQKFSSSDASPEALTYWKIPIVGAAQRPWCHIELLPSDYKTRRQSDTPLDANVRVMEITSIGTHNKNTKRFYVSNPTAEPLDFIWTRDESASESKPAASAEDDPFLCKTRRGTILPGKKFEMVFEFIPTTIETRESFWRFFLVGPKVEEQFLVAGTVQEPRVGMNLPAINFGEYLLEGAATEIVTLVNKEHIPFSFAIDPSSFQLEGSPPALSISPMSGSIGPDGTQDITVTFKPLEEKSFNFNVVCKIKRKKEPAVLNVKGIGYKIHAALEVEEPAGRRTIHLGVPDYLDFGQLQVQEKRTIMLYLRNESKRNVNYRVLLQSGANKRSRTIGPFEKPPYLNLSASDGVAEHHQDTPIEITYAPRDVHALDGSTLQVVIPAGPKDDVFNIQLSGGAKRSKVDFSFMSYDFGPCFIARGGATMAGEPFETAADSRYETAELIVTNRDDQDVMISSNFQREPWLDVKLDATMIASGETLKIPIVFSPREVTEYAQQIEFIVNDYTKMHVAIRGRGCPMRLELTDLVMQNVDFGVTTGGETVTKTVKMINRSARPVTFNFDPQLVPQNQELLDRSVSWKPDVATTLKPRETCEVELKFNPTYRIAPFKMPIVASCSGGLELRLLQASGTCHAVEMRLSEHSVFFGDVIVGSQATRSMRLHNFGDLGSKFKFDIPAKYAKVFSVTPAEGYVRPNEEIPVTVTFHPTPDRVLEFKKEFQKAARQRGKPVSSDNKEITISVKDIKCVLDGHAPLTLEASGRCVHQVSDAEALDFNTEVRVRQTHQVQVTNPTSTDWKVRPQCTTTEPAGTTFFSCAKEVAVPANGTATLDVMYTPLTMTVTNPEDGGDEAAESKEKKDLKTTPERLEKHRGTLFIGTPDGQAISYMLSGVAAPPNVGNRLEEEVPCKKQYTMKVPVKNWLHEKQRFDVAVELVTPEPSSVEAQGISLQGVKTLDLPPGLQRDYKFGVYAYHAGNALVRVTLTSQQTGEFMIIEVNFNFVAVQSLATIEMKSACRQLARHQIAVANPLQQMATFTGKCSNPDIRFSPETIEVPPRSEKTIDLLFRPLEEGSGEAIATLESSELGTYPYTVSWNATAPGLERTLIVKAPLDGFVADGAKPGQVESFKFMHYAKQQVAYKARIEAAPSHKGNPKDFVLETPEVNAPPASEHGSEVSLDIRYQPSGLGECRALLVVSGPGGGEYKALLTGYAQPPQPQGPIVVQNGKARPVTFRNPFAVATTFSIQVDNPAFVVPMREQRIDPQQNVAGGIQVTFKSDRTQGGRLIISCPQSSTPWIFFLKGEL